MINVGVIGAGKIVPTFMKATKLVKGFHYRAISSHTESRLIQMKEEYGFDYYTTNNDDIYNDPKIDVIYVATPNMQHYEVAKQALLHGKHVICEKPFCHTYKKAKELVELANKKNLIVYEGIMNQHMPNYKKIKELLPKLGQIRMVDLNFAQYSSRYDAFLKGEIAPAFDVKKAGGALMDLNIYNIHFCVGLFGEPKKVLYYPNIERKVDVSGVLVLDYGKFKAVCMASKDSNGLRHVAIQGEKGHIKYNDTASILAEFDYCLNNKEPKTYSLNQHKGFSMFHEIKDFKRIYQTKDFETAKQYNNESLITMKILQKALDSANISFEK